MAKKPHIIGLTGSIGMGKSTAAKLFVEEDVPLFDADAQVHLLQAAGGELVAQIEAEFPGTTNENGLDRGALGKVVLDDRDKMTMLEEIIHPAVGRKRMEFLSANSDCDIILFDIPLLFETGGAEFVDSIVVVSAPATLQRERVLARPGMSKEKFESILALQMPDAEKRSRADYVIENGSSIDEMREQIRNFLKELRSTLVSSLK